MNNEELMARLDALEADNKRLQQSNEELSGEVAIWKPSQRVEVATPQDRRTVKEFVTPRANVRQFKLSEAAAMDENDLLRAITNHCNEQLAHLSDAPKALVDNVKTLYPRGILAALRGRHKDARREGYRDFSHALILGKFGFQTFVSDSELRTIVF